MLVLVIITHYGMDLLNFNLLTLPISILEVSVLTPIRTSIKVSSRFPSVLAEQSQNFNTIRTAVSQANAIHR
jgi:hypothetical protein